MYIDKSINFTFQCSFAFIVTLKPIAQELKKFGDSRQLQSELLVSKTNGLLQEMYKNKKLIYAVYKIKMRSTPLSYLQKVLT